MPVDERLDRAVELALDFVELRELFLKLCDPLFGEA